MVKDTAIKYVDFDPCTPVVEEKMQVSLCNKGKLLTVSICLRNVCLDSYIAIGVLICHNNKPYALKTKEVYTGESCNPCCDCCCNCCCNCYYCCSNSLLVEGFEFIFPFESFKKKVAIKVVAHYIC